MVVLLIVVAAAAPAVSAAGQEASGQPGRPAVNVVQVIPKVTVAAKPKAALADMDVHLEGIAADQALPEEEQKKVEPELSDKVAQMMRPTEEQREDKQDQKESGKEKPIKMVLQVDLWGNLRFVPERPGC
jgi:hypothetical protein